MPGAQRHFYLFPLSLSFPCRDWYTVPFLRTYKFCFEIGLELEKWLVGRSEYTHCKPFPNLCVSSGTVFAGRLLGLIVPQLKKKVKALSHGCLCLGRWQKYPNSLQPCPFVLAQLNPPMCLQTLCGSQLHMNSILTSRCVSLKATICPRSDSDTYLLK